MRFAPGLLLASALLAAAALLADRIVDDTFITLRYARHWVEGLGPVFNPGERVEGYTNFLWTALLAAVHAAGRSLDLPRAAQLLALGAGIAAVVQAGCIGRRIAGTTAGLIVALSLALHSPLVAWSIAGLETSLFAALVLAAAARELAHDPPARASFLAPLFLALATMTRPDGIVFAVALLGLRLLHGEARRALQGGALFLALYLPYWLWRWRYYGDPVPNTFYAKVGGGAAQWWRGVDYVRDWAATYGVWWLPLAAWGAWLGRRERALRLLAGMAAAGLFYVVAVGGESLGFYRFMVPVAPFLALLGAAGGADLARRLAARARGPAPARVAVALLVVPTWVASAVPIQGPLLFPERFRRLEPRSGLSFPGEGSDHDFTWFDNYFVARQRVAAQWLERNAPPGALVAATPAGSIGWHMRLPLLDMLGLNDRHIAHVAVDGMGSGRAGHEKGDGRYVLSRRPRYLLLGNVAVFDHEVDEAEMESRLKFISEHEIWASPEFRRDYARRCVRVGDAGPFQFFTFYELR